MKKTLLTLSVLLACYFAGAQNTNESAQYKREGKTSVQSAQESQMMKGDTLTAYTWRDSKGQEYPIILHRYTKGEKAGKVVAYVIRLSKKSGKEYRYFLPEGEKIATEILSETK